MAWGDPGVTERQLVLETPVATPGQAGGRANLILQRAGFLERLRFNLFAELAQSAGTGAPVKSVKGVVGSVIDRIVLQANGMLPLVDLSGLMAMLVNEVQNRDGGPIAPSTFQADLNISGAAVLAAYPAGATGVVTYLAKHPFEFQMAVPLMVNQQKVEWGLWLLQNQTVDLNLQVSWNNLLSAAASVDALYSGGTGVVATTTLAGTRVDIERSLYTVPAKVTDYPDINWAHQQIEFTQPIVSNFARFDLPKAGILLKAIIYTEDANGLPVEYTDIKDLSWVYGANAAPIKRTGAFLTNEFVHDYNRYPPKGIAVLDFYKWGGDGLKTVKSTQDLANLRIETNYTATASGRQRIVLDRMVPIARMTS